MTVKTFGILLRKNWDEIEIFFVNELEFLERFFVLQQNVLFWLISVREKFEYSK